MHSTVVDFDFRSPNIKTHNFIVDFSSRTTSWVLQLLSPTTMKMVLNSSETSYHLKKSSLEGEMDYDSLRSDKFMVKLKSFSYSLYSKSSFSSHLLHRCRQGSKLEVKEGSLIIRLHLWQYDSISRGIVDGWGRSISATPPIFQKVEGLYEREEHGTSEWAAFFVSLNLAFYIANLFYMHLLYIQPNNYKVL